MADSNSKPYLGIIGLVVIVLIAYLVLNMPDRRSGTEKLGDAIHELPKGPDKAVRELGNRTPADKINDAVKDATH